VHKEERRKTNFREVKEHEITSAKTESFQPMKLTVPDPNRDHVQGPLDAPVMLLEYGDYECPYCGQVFPIVKEIQNRLGDNLCFAFRNFPLTNIHPHAEHAAEAAEAAGAQGKFWAMHDVLFENQDALDDEHLLQYAMALRLDARRLIAEVIAGAYAPRLREDFMSGVRAGVNGTPTFFINGERYDGGRGLVELLTALTPAGAH
jgi:protein-disulfide isomerase